MSALPPVDKAARPLLPACLQHRAPARYEILDQWDRRVFPTLAGYRLQPGDEYKLRVETQEGDWRGWSLHIAPPPRFIDWPSADAPQGKSRVLSIRTRDYLRDHWLQLLDSSTVHLSLRIEYDDARPPYTFEIPVILARRWLYAPILLAGALSAVPVPWPLPWRAALVAGGAIVAAALCWLADLIRCHGRARRLVADVRERKRGPAGQASLLDFEA